MEYLILFFIFLFGASVGSFLNVVIDRLIQEENLSGRSHCDFCHHKLSWYDLLPILSFFILKGRCRYCQKKLSWQYPVVELATGIIYVLIFNFQFSVFKKFSILNFQTFLNLDFLRLLIFWGIFSCFIIIFVSDFKYHLVSDYVFWALFGFVFLDKIITVIPAKAGIQIISSIVSSLIVALPIFLIYFISRERAMGFGDVILSAIIGFLLGWQKGFLALYIAFVVGGIYGIILIFLQLKKLKSKIAFGPFIIIGVVLMLVYGDKILEMVKKYYGI
ncbi:MAG: A24 family peptidase [Candidatus Microgenomates bacterium]